MIQCFERGDRLVWRNDLGRYEVVPKRGTRVKFRSTTGTVDSHTSQWIGAERRWFCFVLVDGYGKTMLFPARHLRRLA